MTPHEPASVEKNVPGAPRGVRWGPIILIAAALSLYFIVSRPPAAPAGWGEDFAAAVREAHTSGRKLVIDFYSEGCPPCMAMDRVVLPDAQVQAELRNFVPVRVNVVRDPETTAAFAVSGTPTFAVVSPDGKPLSRIEGYVTPEIFVAFLRNAPPAPSRNPPEATQSRSSP